MITKLRHAKCFKLKVHRSTPRTAASHYNHCCTMGRIVIHFGLHSEMILLKYALPRNKVANLLQSWPILLLGTVYVLQSTISLCNPRHDAWENIISLPLNNLISMHGKDSAVTKNKLFWLTLVTSASYLLCIIKIQWSTGFFTLRWWLDFPVNFMGECFADEIVMKLRFQQWWHFPEH